MALEGPHLLPSFLNMFFKKFLISEEIVQAADFLNHPVHITELRYMLLGTVQLWYLCSVLRNSEILCSPHSEYVLTTPDKTN